MDEYRKLEKILIEAKINMNKKCACSEKYLIKINTNQ
jgi:hypothetical protein